VCLVVLLDDRRRSATHVPPSRSAWGSGFLIGKLRVDGDEREAVADTQLRFGRKVADRRSGGVSKCGPEVELIRVGADTGPPPRSPERWPRPAPRAPHRRSGQRPCQAPAQLRAFGIASSGTSGRRETLVHMTSGPDSRRLFPPIIPKRCRSRRVSVPSDGYRLMRAWPAGLVAQDFIRSCEAGVIRALSSFAARCLMSDS